MLYFSQSISSSAGVSSMAIKLCTNRLVCSCLISAKYSLDKHFFGMSLGLGSCSETLSCCQSSSLHQSLFPDSRISKKALEVVRVGLAHTMAPTLKLLPHSLSLLRIQNNTTRELANHFTSSTDLRLLNTKKINVNRTRADKSSSLGIVCI